MANKTNEELNKNQETATEEVKEKETKETKPETEGKKGEKKEKEPWSMKKKAGVGGAILLTVIGGALWIKNKFFNGNGEDGESDE